MIFLGIDPGSRHTGYGLVEKHGSNLKAVAQGRLSPSARDLPHRLVDLSSGVEQLLHRFSPDAVAIESLFHGVNSRSLIVLAQARGAILTALGRHDVVPREFSPAEVKRTVTGNGRADKDQVARMVELLLGMRGQRRTADATDALALAICHSQTWRMDRVRDRLDDHTESRVDNPSGVAE